MFKYFILMLAITSFPAPLVLEEHSFRQFDSIQFYPIKSSPSFLSINAFKFGISNKTYSAEKNRMLVYAADSMVFGDINFNFRLRVDQKGLEAKDLNWVDSSHSWTYDLDRIVMDWKVNSILRLKLGKDRFNWGSLRLGGLLLSDYNEGFVAFYQEYNLGPFVLKGLCTQLNSVQDTGTTVVKRRYYSASRLEYSKARAGFGLSQSIIYAGEKESFELQYMIPFFPYYYGMNIMHRGGDYQDNNMGGVDYYFYPAEKLKIYGELVIDEFAVETDKRSQSVQNSYGWMNGMDYSFKEKYSLFVELGRITSFVYNHYAGPPLRYLIDDGIIGSPLGPDQKLLWASASRKMGKTWDLAFNLWHRQSGQRKIDTLYKALNTSDDPDPYGTVERENTIWLTNKVTLHNVNLKLETGAVRYKNKANMSGNDKTYPFINLSINAGLAFTGRN